MGFFNKDSRSWSFFTLAVDYIAAAIIGLAVFFLVSDSFTAYQSIFIADVAATIFIWIKGLVFKNVSVYDPYWSVAPPVILTIWAFSRSFWSLPAILLLVAVWFWAVRLTCNWAVTFKNLNSEDWRYTKYRNECRPALFQLINFFGLNMMPTVVVFFAMLPGLELTTLECGANILTFVGFAICVGAVVLQLVSDSQSHKFRSEHKGQVCDVGLWKHGRHPNYFGEISMWWGVWLMYVSVAGLSTNAWYVVGPLSITALFCFVSVPLMEKRQLASKPGYAQYRKDTRMFI